MLRTLAGLFAVVGLFLLLMSLRPTPAPELSTTSGTLSALERSESPKLGRHAVVLLTDDPVRYEFIERLERYEALDDDLSVYLQPGTSVELSYDPVAYRDPYLDPPLQRAPIHRLSVDGTPLYDQATLHAGGGRFFRVLVGLCGGLLTLSGLWLGLAGRDRK